MRDLVSVWLGGLDGETWWAAAADEPALAASLMKVPVAIAAQRRHERGELDLDAPVPVHPDFDSVMGGRFELAASGDQDPATWSEVGSTQTLRELRRRSIVDSGNLATNLLIEQVGLLEVAVVLGLAGCGPATMIPRGIGDEPATRAGIHNLVTARDLGRVLVQTPAEVEDVMLGQTYRSGIPAGLPDGVRVANKTGWIDHHTHDMAIVRPDEGEPFALVVLIRMQGLSTEEGYAGIAEAAGQAWERRR